MDDKTNQVAVRTPQDLANFKKAIDKIADANALLSRGRRGSFAYSYGNWTLDDIKEMLHEGDPQTLRDLSIFFYRTNGIYRRIVEYYSNLLLNDYVMTPHIHETQAKGKIKKQYDAALAYLDNFNIPETFREVTSKVLRQGAYYCLLRVFPVGIVLQELPPDYCRTRYKNEEGVQILELNLQYFDALSKIGKVEDVLSFFPGFIIRAYKKMKDSHKKDAWVEIPPNLGTAFFFKEQTPFFSVCIPEIFRLEQAQDRESDRDSEDLEKLLTVEMPIDTKVGEPVFSLEETEIIHEGLARMLEGKRFIDVLTTFGKTTLHKTQDSSGFGQQNDSMTRFSRSLYEQLGVSAQLFNAEGNTALKYSVDKDTSMMYGFSLIYTHWLTFLLNNRFRNNKMSFEVEFLPTTIHNRKDMMDTYLKGAQFGYSKIYVGVAQGIRQSSLTSLLHLENEVLNLDEIMVPLQSSHTISNDEKDEKKDGKSKTANGDKDKNSEPGRPELSDSDKSDKTIQNRDAM